MRLPSRDTWIRFAILLVGFWLLPALVRLVAAPEAGMAISIALLFVVFPLVTAFLAFQDGQVHGFGWWWIIVPAASFATTLFVHYNESAAIYAVFIAVAATAGSGVGALLGRQATRG